MRTYQKLFVDHLPSPPGTTKVIVSSKIKKRKASHLIGSDCQLTGDKAGYLRFAATIFELHHSLLKIKRPNSVKLFLQHQVLSLVLSVLCFSCELLKRHMYVARQAESVS